MELTIKSADATYLGDMHSLREFNSKAGRDEMMHDAFPRLPL
jgi:hypothetical protein